MAESPGLVSLLLSHGLEEVVATVLLLLAPEDLKACRRVCRSWNTLILARLWGTRAGRRGLEAKARNRWGQMASLSIFSFVIIIVNIITSNCHHHQVEDQQGHHHGAGQGQEPGGCLIRNFNNRPSTDSQYPL